MESGFLGVSRVICKHDYSDDGEESEEMEYAVFKLTSCKGKACVCRLVGMFKRGDGQKKKALNAADCDHYFKWPIPCFS